MWKFIKSSINSLNRALKLFKQGMNKLLLACVTYVHPSSLIFLGSAFLVLSFSLVLMLIYLVESFPKIQDRCTFCSPFFFVEFLCCFIRTHQDFQLGDDLFKSKRYSLRYRSSETRNAESWVKGYRSCIEMHLAVRASILKVIL